MLSAIRLAFTHPQLRAVMVALMMLGLTYASTIPYQSLIATSQLGFSDGQFGLLMFLIGIAALIGTLAFGYVSDIAKSRKTAVLWCLGLGGAGFASFSLDPGPHTFLLCMLLIYPMANSAYSLLFGTVRSLANDLAPEEPGSINAAVRSFYAISWIVMPALVGAFIAATGRASDSFAIAALAFMAGLLFYWRFGPNVAGNAHSAGGALDNVQAALSLILDGPRLIRIVAVSLVNCAHPFTLAVLPLFVIQKLGSPTGTVGILLGVIAFMEMPVMIGVGAMARRLPVWQIIVAGGVLHAMFMLALTQVNSTLPVYPLALLDAGANAVLLTQHLTYVQDLMPDRPGLGSSLLSIVSLISRAGASAVFAGIGLVYGLSGALATCAMVCLLGCAGVAVLSRPAISS